MGSVSGSLLALAKSSVSLLLLLSGPGMKYCPFWFIVVFVCSGVQGTLDEYPMFVYELTLLLGLWEVVITSTVNNQVLVLSLSTVI